MKKKTKSIYGILALLLTLALAACVSPTNAPSGGSSGTSAPAAPTVTLKFQTIGTPQPDVARISKAASDYLKGIGKNYAIDIAIEDWGTYTDVVNLRLSTGENFDVVFTANWAASFYTNAPNGVFTDLTPYIAKNPEIEQILTKDFMNATQINGKNFALPTNKEKARQMGWVLRKDIVEAMGMDISKIKTVEDLEPWFIKAHDEHGLWIWSNFVISDNQYDRIEEPIIGLSLDTSSHEVIACDLDEAFINAVKLNNKWFKMGLINPNLTRESSGDSEFATGKYFAITYQLKPGKDAELSASVGFDLVQIPMNTPQIANSETSGAMLAIPTASTHKDEAFDFIKMLYTDKELLNLILWGQEGVDFDFVKPGIIELKKDSGWSWGQGWTLGNQFNNYLMSNEDPDKWKKFEEFNKSGVPLASLGFVPDTTSTEMQTYIAGMKAVRDNYSDLFLGYVDDVDGAFNKMRQEYKTAGMDELIAAYQSQFDAWLASK